MIKSPDCSTLRRRLKWITTDYRNGATSSLAETKQIWWFASEKKRFALWASCTFSFPILMRQQGTSCWVWPDRANTIPGISCISNLFSLLPTISRSRSEQHTRGPWSPWSPCRGWEEGIWLQSKLQYKTPHKHAINNLRNRRVATQNTEIRP